MNRPGIITIAFVLAVTSTALPTSYGKLQDLDSLATMSAASSCNFNGNGSLAITVWSLAVQVWRKTNNGYSLLQSITPNGTLYFGDFSPDASVIAVGGYRFVDVYVLNTLSGMYEWKQRLST